MTTTRGLLDLILLSFCSWKRLEVFNIKYVLKFFSNIKSETLYLFKSAFFFKLVISKLMHEHNCDIDSWCNVVPCATEHSRINFVTEY